MLVLNHLRASISFLIRLQEQSLSKTTKCIDLQLLFELFVAILIKNFLEYAADRESEMRRKEEVG